MDNKISDILKNNGWSEGRKINIDNVLSFWESQNYSIDINHIKFIEEFGFLTIEFNNHYIDIDPLKRYFSNETLKIFEEFFNTKLIPTGQIKYENSFILIGSNGKIYGGFEEFVCFYGNEIFEFIQNILNDNVLWNEIEELK